MILDIRGRLIRCAAKPGNAGHYRRLYESLSNERLDELAQETKDDEQLQVQGIHTS